MYFSQELENAKKFRDAEKYYLEAKDWKAVVNMYRSNDMWPEAHRVNIFYYLF